jgi:predicted membrane channel-forming protein YqfA (hemolysin III family)
MEDFPTKIADLLETFATRVRSMTVDKLAGAARWTAASLVLIVLFMALFVFLIIALVRILDGLLPGDVGWVYVLLGGLFLLLGAFLWSRRKPVIEEN